MNRSLLAITVVIIVIVAAVGVTFYASSLTKATQSTSSALTTSSSSMAPVTSSSSHSSLSSTSSSTSGGYYFLVFTQKGMVQLASPAGSLLGYQRLYNISDSVPAQNYYWNEYPTQGVTASNLLIPLNNGTVEILNVTTMKIVSTISVGSKIGFIGVAVNPNQTLAAVADGPSGIVEVMNLETLQVLWKTTFNTPAGSTAWPCDVRWSPDGNSIGIPMRLNGSVDVVNAQTGSIMASAIVPTATLPYMLSISNQGNQVAVELAGNKTDVFYSYPALKLLGDVGFNSSFMPQRGVYTTDDKYYLEASSSSNVVDVISTSDFKIINTLSLPPSSSPGLADIELTPDSNYAFVVMHGTPTTGGVVYLIPLTNIATVSSSSLLSSLGSIALTTAPAFALPISISSGTYLADNVLSPPVTGLHC